MWPKMTIYCKLWNIAPSRWSAQWEPKKQKKQTRLDFLVLLSLSAQTFTWRSPRCCWWEARAAACPGSCCPSARRCSPSRPAETCSQASSPWTSPWRPASCCTRCWRPGRGRASRTSTVTSVQRLLQELEDTLKKWGKWGCVQNMNDNKPFLCDCEDSVFGPFVLLQK